MGFQKTEEEILLIKKSSLLVSKTLSVVGKEIRPGITTKYLDTIAESFIWDNGGQPAFKGYRNFPATLCISLNDEVVHGIPGERILKEGDVVSVDCGVLMNGYYGDSAYSFIIEPVQIPVRRLLEVTKECLYRGISKAVHGNYIGDIAHEIQEHAEKNGFSVVRELVGHGIGKSLHESPEVPNYGKKGSGMLLRDGMTIAIEPMINMGHKSVRLGKDKWTIRTADGKPSAHFEHTIAVKHEKAEILSSFEEIEVNLK